MQVPPLELARLEHAVVRLALGRARIFRLSARGRQLSRSGGPSNAQKRVDALVVQCIPPFG
jgi:hypothetical protein